MKTFNSVKELFELLKNADLNGDVILCIEDIYGFLDKEDYEGKEDPIEKELDPYKNSEETVVFVPLGHMKYLKFYRDISNPNCHPSVAALTADVTKLKECSVPIWDLANVVRYIARSFFENAFPGTKIRSTLFINGEEYMETEDFEKDVERMIDEEGF